MCLAQCFDLWFGVARGCAYVCDDQVWLLRRRTVTWFMQDQMTRLGQP